MNTRVPLRQLRQYRLLRPIVNLPRLSTYAVGAVINRGVECMPRSSCYINVGVWYGFTFFAGVLGNPDRRCIAVDNFSEDFSAHGRQRTVFRERFARLATPRHSFYECDYKDYFANVHDGSPIGFYVYDGPHSYDDQMTGLTVADQFLVPGAYVLIDDTNPGAYDGVPRQAVHDFVRTNRNRYDVVFDAVTATNDHPTFWSGITLLARR